MSNIKTILLCANVNFRKWPANPRIYTLAAAIFAFLAYHMSGLTDYASTVNINVAPWVFPYLFSRGIMVLVFGCFTALLFCDAPFADSHMSFLVIRCGRRNWILGQLIYIIEASFLYTAFVLIASMLVLIPHIEFTTEWGKILKTIALNPDSPTHYGIDVSITVSQAVIGMYSTMEATMISFGLFWLVSAFVGVLILFFNVVIAKMSGVIAAGLIIFISYFSVFLGWISFGNVIHYLSPLSWINMDSLDLNHTGFLPSPAFVVLVLLGLILSMSLFSVKRFSIKDMKQ